MDLPFPLFWKILVSLVGMVWLAHGRRQRDWIATIAGILLAVMPYMVSNALLLVLLAAGVSVVAWKLGA